VEVTPGAIRLRKRVLAFNQRPKRRTAEGQLTSKRLRAERDSLPRSERGVWGARR